ncbi:MAG TPA: DUF885 domain-containing protein [Thermoanaerobaculia bacterium]|nr:DUF885 domain-containing protein [Thermoanaerobaculia bacterium]
MRFFAVLLLFTSTLSAAEMTAADLDKRRKALADVIEEQWQYALRTSPEFASYLGDKRYNDQSTDYSAAAQKRNAAQTRAFLKRAEAIDTTGFADLEKVNKALFVRNLRESIADYQGKDWLMPVNQMGGIHLQSAQLPAMLSFTSAKDYDDYITRMRNFPRQVDDTIANMRAGMHDKLMPPKFLLEKVAGQAAGIAAQPAEESPFAIPLKSFPASVSEEDRARIRSAFVDAIRTAVVPAYQKFAAFVRDEYAPAGRAEAGVWSLPDGAKRYARYVRESTTTNLTPEEIHQIGLREVARIEGEMLAIAKKFGFNDLKSFNASVDKNPDLRAKSREQILDIYRGYINQMYEQLPKLFGRLPKAKVEVVPVEPFREKEAASANYELPAPDGSRPGRVYVNTYDSQSRKIIFMESTAYHEGVPGHHMQIAIAQELPDLPEFRRQGGYNAFVEGWALYSERLGKEVGFYQNPYVDYGRLNDEMLRAIRLVVDTGLHYKKWTREQVVQFFHDHSATDEVEVQSETDRYIVWPGQALGYKIGQLKILELRERAKKQLGDRFDIREFHDQVLGAGALPLDVLEQRIDAWMKK